MTRLVSLRRRSVTPALAAAGLLLFAMPCISARAQQTGGAEVTATLDTVKTASTTHAQAPNQDRQSDLQVIPQDLAKAELAPGYLLEMDIFDVPEFSAMTLRVSAAGDVIVPRVDHPIHLQGDTIPAAELAIAAALKEGDVLVDPKVKLNILQYPSQSITVLGEVQSPGHVEVLGPRLLDDVLGLAGGETVSAGNDIEIERGGSGGRTEISHVPYTLQRRSSSAHNVLVYPGDTVLVHRAGVIYVLGAVTKPGAYLMVNGGTLSVLQGVSLAGGTLLDASTNNVSILRPEGESYHEIKVPYGKMTHGKAEPVQLQLNDILYVSRSRVKTAMVDGSYLLGSTINASLYRIY